MTGADRAAALAGAITVAGMVATPLLPPGGAGRRLLSSVVVGGIWATTTANAIRRWGAPRAAAASVSTGIVTGLVERVGTRTGIPFGRYAYTDALRPQIAHVPVIVPLAWFGMGLPAREAAHAALGRRSTPSTRIALGAIAITGWDLFLDPQMVGEGYWAWARRGAYRGIPISNFAGWLLTGFGIMALLEALLPPDHRPPPGTDQVEGRNVHQWRLVGEYGYMSVMQTLAFARFFRDPVVAVVGGLAMLPIAAGAAVRLLGTAR